MARYEALKHIRVGDQRVAPGDPLVSEGNDGRDWPSMVRMGDVGPWPSGKAWPGEKEPSGDVETAKADYEADAAAHKEGDGSANGDAADSEKPATDAPARSAAIVEGSTGWLSVMDGETKIGKSTRDQAEAKKIKVAYESGEIGADGVPVKAG